MSESGLARALSRMGLAGALGVNLWVLGLVVPVAFAGATRTWPTVPVAPIILGYGLARRSAAALLLGVPVATLAPLALPELENARQSPLGFVLVLGSLVAYAIAALFALAAADAKAAVAQVTHRDLEPSPVPERWARRQRIFRALSFVALALPALLIYAIDLHPATAATVAASFPGDTERALAFMTALAGLVAATVFGAHLVRPLAAHLDRDFAIRVGVERNRLTARRGRPRAIFYAAVGFAVVLLALAMAARR